VHAPLSHQQLAYPFLGPFLSTLFSVMHPSTHIVSLPSLLCLTFYPFLSLSFSLYTFPYFTSLMLLRLCIFSSSYNFFPDNFLNFFLLINFARLSFILFLSSSSFRELLYPRLLSTYASCYSISILLFVFLALQPTVVVFSTAR
jgi:hypothetical protein